MTSPTRAKQKFETFVMTGDTIIKTRSVSHAKSSQISLVSYEIKESRSSPTNGSDIKSQLSAESKKDRDGDANYSEVETAKHPEQKLCASKSYELDIPPDDISSEDELYKEESVVDATHLPPPPDDFLTESSPAGKSLVAEIISVEKCKPTNLDVVGYNQLNRHRSYESFDSDRKPQDCEKCSTPKASAAIDDVTDQLKSAGRNYKSHENYLQLKPCVEFVPIVFDETGAISVDALNYNKIDYSPNSLDYSTSQNSVCLSPAERGAIDFSRLNECNRIKTRLDDDIPALDSNGQASAPPPPQTGWGPGVLGNNCDLNDSAKDEIPLLENAFPSNSLLRNVKDADLPSAQRLAKRLFALDGFQRIDVAKLIGKKDAFSVLVGQEYLKNFDFTGQKLDVTLRAFLSNLTLVGETQERERVLAHFSHRFVECNPDFILSEDSCHTLICAMMLLNIDHHSQNISRKMTLDEFVENLSCLNDGCDFPRDLLKEVYLSVCNEPFECPIDDSGLSAVEEIQSAPCNIGSNPFLSLPDANKAREYKRGFVMRKCCMDSDGHRTSFGKRGWRMFYATLKDLVLYLHKDEHGMRRHSTSGYQNHHNVVRIHHAFAERAEDYLKKQHVFRLTTSNSAQYLFQTSDNTECQSWINCINYVAASLSAAPLPSAVGSQKRFQRPLMPSSQTKLTLPDQLKKVKDCLVMCEMELANHRRHPPEKGTKSRVINDYIEKENFLSFEVKRFVKYIDLLQYRFQIMPQTSSMPLGNHQAADAGSNSILHEVIEESNPTTPEDSSCPTARNRCPTSFHRSQSDRQNCRPAFAFS